MSGAGAADTTLTPEDYRGFKLAIVAASWHTQVMDGLLDGARRAAADAGVELLCVFRAHSNYLWRPPAWLRSTTRLWRWGL